jgi:hypothetical protein
MWTKDVGREEKEIWTRFSRMIREAMASSPRCSYQDGRRPSCLSEGQGWRVQLASSAHPIVEEDEEEEEEDDMGDLPKLDFGPPGGHRKMNPGQRKGKGRATKRRDYLRRGRPSTDRWW